MCAREPAPACWWRLEDPTGCERIFGFIMRRLFGFCLWGFSARFRQAPDLKLHPFESASAVDHAQHFQCDRSLLCVALLLVAPLTLGVCFCGEVSRRLCAHVGCLFPAGSFSAPMDVGQPKSTARSISGELESQAEWWLSVESLKSGCAGEATTPLRSPAAFVSLEAVGRVFFSVMSLARATQHCGLEHLRMHDARLGGCERRGFRTLGSHRKSALLAARR